MKKLGKMLRKSIVFCFVMFVICAFIYPFALTGISQLTMKNKANGNLIDKKRRTYFKCRRGGRL